MKGIRGPDVGVIFHRYIPYVSVMWVEKTFVSHDWDFDKT